MVKWWIVVTFLAFVSCGSGGDKLFDIEIETDFTIAPGLNTLDTHYFILRRIPTRFNNYLGSIGPDAVGQVLPTRARLEAPFSQIDWSMVREVSIWATSINDPSLKKELFYQDRIELKEQQDLKLFSSLSEVKDIMMEEYFHLEIRFKFRTFTPTEIDTRLTMNFVVNGTE